jgi:hypothetical protein
LDKPLPNTTPRYPMRSTAFVFLLFAVAAAAIWLGLRLITNTDPDVMVNVVLFLFALFLAFGSLGTLVAWLLWARRWGEPKGYQIAVRQGIWVGLFATLLAALQVWHLFSWLAVGALVLVLGSLEALLLLQPDATLSAGSTETTPKKEP